MAPSPPATISGPLPADPDQPLLLSLENYDAETKRAHENRHLRAAHAGATQDRRSMSRPPPRRWPSRSTRPAEFTGRAWRSSPGTAPRQIAARARQPGLPQPRGRMGDRRPLFERRRAREAQDRRSRGQPRSFLPPQRRGLEGRPARRSPARRHQRPPRLLLDSGERRARHSSRNCSTCPSAPSPSAIPAP